MRAFVLLLVSLLAVAPPLCAADDAAPALDEQAQFRAGVQAIEAGAFGDAIDRFELLADRGFVHPDASFNRAVAYLGRARSTQKKPGDFGRAAAALAETLSLRPEDREAESALESVRTEIARGQARRGGSSLVARPRLLRALVGLLPEEVWGALAVLGSLAAAAGLALRFLLRRPGSAVPAALAIAVGALLLTLGGALAASARHFRRTSTLAVVVVPEARLLDEAGRPLSAGEGAMSTVAPEGAEVYVLEHRGGLTRVEWGSTAAWVVAGQVREVARP